MSTNSTVAVMAALALAACGGKSASTTDTVQAAAPASSALDQSQVVVRGTAVVKDNHAIIQSEAVGPLRVGMWRRQAMSLVYPVTATGGAPGEDMLVVRGIGRDTMTLAVIDDTVRRVLVTRPGPHTDDSIQVGTPLARVAAMRGARVSGSGATQRVVLPGYCGVEFSGAAEPSGSKAALTRSRSSTVPVVRTIIVGPCAGGATAR